MAEHMSPSSSADTLRSEIDFRGTPKTQSGSWGSPYSIDFDFGTDSPSLASTVSTGTPTAATAPKWSTATKKSRNNFAAFGAKLQSTAEKAAAHATASAKKKHHHLGHHGEKELAGAPLLKSKMFRQSKPDLKSLTISERSPIANSGSSKELDRIAAIGSPTAESSSTKHHTHLTFLKRDSPAQILSSSASNSKLASEGSVYSFQPAPAPASGSAVGVHAFKSAEECFAFMTSSWSLVRSRVQPIFSNDGLKIPVEDVNIVVSMHFGAHVKSGGTAADMISRLDELVRAGLQSAPVAILPGGTMDILGKLAASWKTFYTRILGPLESVFLPLQLEIDGAGQVLRESAEASEYWKPVRTARGGRRAISKRPVSVHRSLILAYRDVVLLPVLGEVEAALGGQTPQDMAARVLQCAALLVLLHTDDDIQQKMEALLEKIQQLLKREEAIRKVKGYQ